jgi:hypothetical protein
MKAKVFSFTHRTKVFGDGTVPNWAFHPLVWTVVEDSGLNVIV